MTPKGRVGLDDRLPEISKDSLHISPLDMERKEPLTVTLRITWLRDTRRCSNCGRGTHWLFRMGSFLSWARCRKDQSSIERELSDSLREFTGLDPSIESRVDRVDSIPEGFTRENGLSGLSF